MARLGNRLTAQITERFRTSDIGPEEAHVRNVTAITRRIHNGVNKIKSLNKELKQLKAQLKADRRELRAVLQRDSKITEAQMELSGKADAVDAIQAYREGKLHWSRLTKDEKAQVAREAKEATNGR